MDIPLNIEIHMLKICFSSLAIRLIKLCIFIPLIHLCKSLGWNHLWEICASKQ